ARRILPVAEDAHDASSSGTRSSKAAAATAFRLTGPRQISSSFSTGTPSSNASAAALASARVVGPYDLLPTRAYQMERPVTHPPFTAHPKPRSMLKPGHLP